MPRFGNKPGGRLSRSVSQARHGWRSYKRFYNRDSLGSKLLRFALPAFSRFEVIGLVLAVFVAAGILLYVQAHPKLLHHQPGTSQSVAAVNPGSTQPTVTGSATTPSSLPSPSVTTRPPTGFPTTQGAGVPSASLSRQVVLFLNAYYQQAASDTLLSRQAKLATSVPAAILTKLPIMVVKQGDASTPLIDLANMVPRPLANGVQYISVPVALSIKAPDGTISRQVVTSRSTWQPQGTSWLLTFFSDKDSASGR